MYKRFQEVSEQIDVERPCSKWFLLIVNTVFLIIGICGIIAGASFLVNVEKYGFPELQRFQGVWMIVLASVVTFVAFLGCCGAMTKNKCALCLYSTVLLFIFICVLILFVAGICLVAAPEKLKDGMREHWEHLNSSTKSEIEYRVNCCGFDDIHDGGFPCSAESTDPEPCGEKLVRFMSAFGASSIVISVCLMIFCVLAFCATCTVCCASGYVRYFKPSGPTPNYS